MKWHHTGWMDNSVDELMDEWFALELEIPSGSQHSFWLGFRPKTGGGDLSKKNYEKWKKSLKFFHRISFVDFYVEILPPPLKVLGTITTQTLHMGQILHRAYRVAQ